MIKVLVSILFICSVIAAIILLQEKRLNNEEIDERELQLSVGAYLFSFPRNSIGNVVYKQSNKARALISLEFLLPDLLPKTAETVDQFSPHNTLTINISAMNYNPDSDRDSFKKIDTSFNYDLSERVERIFSEPMPHGDGLRLPPLGQGQKEGNLLYYKNKLKGGKGTDVYTNEAGPISLMLECNDEVFWPNPTCVFETHILGHAFLHYRYPRKFVSQAEEIHQFVFTYLNSHFVGVRNHD